ncbi:MAG: type II toxin-antitoxin system VapC family toxin [Treponema sp.]|nr:type II toxin-antitoxin system VapC family toxin [Treponema sp.]
MTESRFVLDTNAVIFLATKGSVIPSSLEEELNEADLFISVISEIELFSKPALPPNEEENLRSFLSSRIPIMELTEAVKKETIALRRSARLKLPDCIIAATVTVLNAVLLTADKELLALSWPGFRAKNLF